MSDKHDWEHIQSNLNINNELIKEMIANTRKQNSSQIDMPKEIYTEHLRKIEFAKPISVFSSMIRKPNQLNCIIGCS